MNSSSIIFIKNAFLKNGQSYFHRIARTLYITYDAFLGRLCRPQSATKTSKTSRLPSSFNKLLLNASIFPDLMHFLHSGKSVLFFFSFLHPLHGDSIIPSPFLLCPKNDFAHCETNQKIVNLLCGPYRARTDHPLLAKQVLYQMS